MAERRADLNASIDKLLATATPDCDGQYVTADGLCIECKIPVVWVDGQGRCVCGACPMCDEWPLLTNEDECDWPGCTSAVFYVDTRRKTQRCESHKSMPCWADGSPRIEIPGQLSLL